MKVLRKTLEAPRRERALPAGFDRRVTGILIFCDSLNGAKSRRVERRFRETVQTKLLFSPDVNAVRSKMGLPAVWSLKVKKRFCDISATLMRPNRITLMLKTQADRAGPRARQWNPR